MTELITIVGLGGSLARTSRSLAALQVALDVAAESGASTKLLNLRELDLPMYNPDDQREPPPAASTLIEACYAADGILWSSPVASAFRVFDSEGRVRDEGVELQLRTLGAEVVRVATRLAEDTTAQRARACEESAERVTAAAVSTATPA